MTSSPKLSGETLIVHHIPLVHCQVSGGRQGKCARNNPFSLPENLGLSRTTSLPERDALQKGSLLYGSLIQTSGSSLSSQNGGKEKKGGRRGGSTASDDSSFTSSNSDDQLIAAHTLPRAKPRSRNPFRHNPFLLNADEDEDEDEDGIDNLSGYHEDSSFHLHSDADPLCQGLAPFHLHDFGFGSEPFRLHGGRRVSHESLVGVTSDLANNLEDLDIQRRHGSGGSNMSMDCGEQDWADEEDEEDQRMRCGRSSKTGSYSSGASTRHCSCCALSRHLSFSECQQGYGSDSSCNSSDGVLVNFSAIYNKMNNSVPEKRTTGSNLNSSADHSCASSASDPPPHQEDSTGGAFYLDLHTSPTEPYISQTSCIANSYPALQAPNLSTTFCPCSVEHQGALDLDANCNSYQPPHFGSSGDLAACLQSQARLVVATQNYYKLVTCDLSSQSSPSPAGSSVHSCSDEHSKGSPSPPQPSEYYLFRQQEEDEDDEEDTFRKKHFHEDDEETDEEKEEEEAGIKGQVYVNVSPPDEDVDGASSSDAGRLRSRSYDRHLDRSPAPRLGSLERMLSCPVGLSEGADPTPPPPPRVTSFAEIARSKRRNGGSPPQKTVVDPFASDHPTHSSLDFSPITEQHAAPVPFTRCYSQGCLERPLEGGRGTRARTEGGPSCSSENIPAVVRYRKDQRPTSLPIQPFTFHHQFASKPPQPKPLLPLIAGYAPEMQVCTSSGSGSGSGGGGGGGGGGAEEEEEEDAQAAPVTTSRPPDSVRLSPLGSYSPVRLQRASSSGTCSTCTPSPKPPHSPSCVLAAGPRSPQTPRQSVTSAPLTPPPPSLGVKRGVVPPTLCYRGPLNSLPALHGDSLSPLGVHESGRTDSGKAAGVRSHNGSHAGKLQLSHSDFLPDYFSLSERPPEEFCLSPDASISCSSSSSQISVDLAQKRGLVKAVNRAVDLIVAHFGSSRDHNLKAKLGNSWVSPNMGHLILKYLCPALHEVLQDGLKAYVLDLIIGQRRCHPWSLVEASTQLGPSTRVLHSLLNKVNQFSELSSHRMRLNAFIFGLLNLKSLEFWFNHLYTHEDIVAAHYHPWGLLHLSQCRPLLEELLLLLQPLSALPFDLDLLFEPHLLQEGEEHLRRKEQLCSSGAGAERSSRSTFQLMRGWSATVGEMVRDSSQADARKEALRRDGTWPRTEARKEGGRRARGAGQDGPREEEDEDRWRDREVTDRQAGWWYQLMQSSQVYIDPSAEGSKFIKTERRRRRSSERRQHPPAREGVVEGAESSTGSRGRPSWMGSPPESVLSQESCTTVQVDQSGSQGQSLRWGRLFGSSLGSPKKSPEQKPQKSRAPSGWLGLDRSVLGLVAQTIGTGSGKRWDPPTQTSPAAPATPPKPQCEVRALCHHIATEPGHLSFSKGDILRVLGKADPEWLLCSLDSRRGLVPVVYVTLASMEESLELQ